MPKAQGKVQYQRGIDPSDKQGLGNLIAPSEQEMLDEFYRANPDTHPPEYYNTHPFPYGDQNALYGAYMERLPSENLLSEMVPANVRAGYSYGRGPITQRFFPERDLNYLRDVYELERQNYMAVTPMDQGFVRGPVPEQKFVPYEEYSRQRAVPTVQSVPGAMNALYSYFDPAYRLAPFTQGAYYEEGPGGMYMHNTYNAGGVPREVNVLLPRRSQR